MDQLTVRTSERGSRLRVLSIVRSCGAVGCVLVLHVVLAALPANAQTCAGSYTLPLDRVSRLSEDGRYVVGADRARGSSIRSAVRFDPVTGQSEFLSTAVSRAYDISDDGTIVLGGVAHPPHALAPFLWTEAGGIQMLPDPQIDYVRASTMQLSGDGATVALSYEDSSGSHFAYRWSATNGFEPLGSLHPSQTLVRVDDVSYDGSVVVGASRAPDGYDKAFRWTSAGGMASLGTLYVYGTGHSRAYGVSADGDVVVGQSSGPGALVHPFTWRSSTGMRRPFPATGPFDSGALLCITSDGQRAGGWVDDPSGRGPMLWAEGAPHVTFETPLGLGYSSFPKVLDTVAGGQVALVAFGPESQYSAVVRLSPLGSSACVYAVSNSTGCTGRIFATGSEFIADDDLTLRATVLPADVLGMFVVGSAYARDAQPVGSVGPICIAGTLGRFDGPGQVASTGASGELVLEVDLSALPQGSTGISAQAGETWTFQAWHRDTVAGAPTSQFTDAVAVTLR